MDNPDDRMFGDRFHGYALPSLLTKLREAGSNMSLIIFIDQPLREKWTYFGRSLAQRHSS